MDNIPAKTDAVACFLDGQAYRTRVARIHALMDQALIARERLETSVRMRFRTDAGVEAHLEALIALERECCPFLVFALERRPDEMVLTISGPESAAALLDEAFGGATVCQAVQTPVLRRHTAGALTAAFGAVLWLALTLLLGAIFVP